jgi:hypothetical protein
MPVLQFKGKSVIETYHHTVPHHRLELDEKLPKGEKPNLKGNLIIEGGNLLALKALLPTHAGGQVHLHRSAVQHGQRGMGLQRQPDAAAVQGMDRADGGQTQCRSPSEKDDDVRIVESCEA